MTGMEMYWPQVNVDCDSRTLGAFTVRYTPYLSVLEYPDEQGRYGNSALTVRDFRADQTMLRRDLKVRITLAELGWSFDRLAMLDNMELSGSPLTESVRQTLPPAEQARFDSNINEHDDALNTTPTVKAIPDGTGSKGRSHIVSVFGRRSD